VVAADQEKPDRDQGYWSLVKPIWNVAEFYEGPAEFLRTFAEIPKLAGLLFAAHFCQSEVINGGLFQFFFNSTGILAPEAIEGFIAIGQVAVAESVQEACSLFGEPYPLERSLRQSKLKTFDPQLFKSLSLKLCENIGSERGGFEAAADRYAAGAGQSYGR
jgi:hypothetical protein